MEKLLSDMKNRFNNRLNELIAAKGQNTQIFTKSAYLTTIQKVKESKTKVTSKLPEEYQRLRRYDVVSIGEMEKLIVPVKEGNLIKYYVHTEEIFQILHDAHTAIGHGGRNRMEKELNTKYKNITREMIVIYLNLCESCQKKQNAPKKNSLMKNCTGTYSPYKTVCGVQVGLKSSMPEETLTNINTEEYLETLLKSNDSEESRSCLDSGGSDSMPLQQRMLLSAPPQVQIPSSAEPLLQSQPLSPTKLKVTRQTNKPQTFTPKVIETPPEEVCLRWNSHHSNMQATFPQLLEKEQYVDVTIIAEEKTLKCHRMILSSCSIYFEEILNGITPLQHPVIILKGIPFWILKALIDFMYVGEVNIDQNKLPELLDVAELLKVKGLAGKTTKADQNEKQENQPLKKQQTKDANLRQQTIKNLPQPTPIITKVEDIPINDPLELLEPKFLEDGDRVSPKIKENKLPSKKNFSKKFRKRKSSEDDATFPLFPMRRGTRSRPNVKIPKYYDYEDIVKPTAPDIQPFSPVVNIKSEPIDFEDNDIPYNESIDTEMDNVSIKNSDLSNNDTNSKPVEKSIINKEPTNSNSSHSNSSNKQQPSLQYKIKIKSLSSLSENINFKVSTEDDHVAAPQKISADGTSLDETLSVAKSDIGEEISNTPKNEVAVIVAETVSATVNDEDTAQNSLNTEVDVSNEIEDGKTVESYHEDQTDV